MISGDPELDVEAAPKPVDELWAVVTVVDPRMEPDELVVATMEGVDETEPDDDV